MKIRIEKGGAHAVMPDFGVLREGLRMAQQMTPTAIANISARALHDHKRFIADVFSDSVTSRTLGPCSFHPDLPPPDRDRAQR
ncbi:hypothetical protein [Sphingomonas sp. MMS24-J13]|uniref:hypothetical protein n=1 Tax=Sphingomonas sp. MMS24-J13 TaxID=3238686 RepID=UPI0038507840